MRISAASRGGSEPIDKKLIIKNLCYLFEVLQVLVVIRQLSFITLFITAHGLACSIPSICSEEDREVQPTVTPGMWKHMQGA